jgi:hypothetical protein
MSNTWTKNAYHAHWLVRLRELAIRMARLEKLKQLERTAAVIKALGNKDSK